MNMKEFMNNCFGNGVQAKLTPAQWVNIQMENKIKSIENNTQIGSKYKAKLLDDLVNESNLAKLSKLGFDD